jgi:nitrogen regulatory protein PII-like uncharacterized protein
MGYIYKIINKIDNKSYIGQTLNSLEERWSHHKGNSSNCRYLKRAFQKYGVENFEMKLICICFDEDLNKFETQYINYYNTLVPNGYNLRQGGNNAKQHQETKQKIGETLREGYNSGRLVQKYKGKPNFNFRGHKHTDETKKKISEKMKGKQNSNQIGKIITEECRQKISEKAKSRTRNENTNKKISEALKKTNKETDVKITIKRKVLQYDINNNFIASFNSLTEAAHKYDVSKAALSKTCNGKTKTCKGFIWKFET